MKLEELKPAAGAKKKEKRVGRGHGSGHGKTSTKGHKGQKARSGGVKPAGFEGGQMPLQRRIPKRGFKNVNRLTYAVVNLKDLAAMAGPEPITPETLVQKGVIRNLRDGLKVLGTGDITTALTVRAHKFSKSAADKIKAAGGSAEVI